MNSDIELMQRYAATQDAGICGIGATARRAVFGQQLCA